MVRAHALVMTRAGRPAAEGRRKRHEVQVRGTRWQVRPALCCCMPCASYRRGTGHQGQVSPAADGRFHHIECSRFASRDTLSEALDKSDVRLEVPPFATGCVARQRARSRRVPGTLIAALLPATSRRRRTVDCCAAGRRGAAAGRGCGAPHARVCWVRCHVPVYMCALYTKVAPHACA